MNDTFPNEGPQFIRQRLMVLKLRLEQVSRSWTVDDYWHLLKFYVRILPGVLNAERCTVYIMEMGTEKICSIMGTGLEKQQIEPPKDKSIVGKVISSGETIMSHDMDKQDGFHTHVDAKTGFVTRNMICAPIKGLTMHGVTGAIQVLNHKGEGSFSEADKEFLNEAADHLSISIESIILNQEILRISNQLNREVEKFDSGYFKDIPFIAESPVMRDVVNLVGMVSTTPVGTLILGENGAGKELVARMIHERSDRRDQPFVAVNCASIPENLMESEFFGYEKGAFTGAEASRKGYFEEASGGTLFLDEIADMPMVIQPKFLRAIQESEGYRLGGKKLISYDLRIISATNKNLKAEAAAGRFREDLYFRLFSVEIRVPPLRERQEDILPLAFTFLDDICKRFKKKVTGFSPEVLQLFEANPWPGNVRQLRKEIERLVALTPINALITKDKCSADLLAVEASNLPGSALPDQRSSLPEQVQTLEVRLIRSALAKSGGNRTRAAEILGITRQGLHKKIKRYALVDK